MFKVSCWLVICAISKLACKLIGIRTFSSTIEEVGSDAISFSRLANYPEYVGRRERCAMCGLKTPRYDKQTSRRATLDFRGVCSICRDKPWKIADGGFEIKYCQHCKTWRQWADFRGLSGLIMVKKCGLCRIKINVARYPTAAQTETAALTNGPRCIPLVPIPVTCSRLVSCSSVSCEKC